MGAYRMIRPEKVAIIINCRDRVTALRDLVAWLERAGHERIFLLDNDSTYEPLLAFYEETPHKVIRLKENLGHRAPWKSGTAVAENTGHWYVVTDPDVVPDDNCPLDAVGRLYDALERYPAANKVGLGLRIDDLPDGYPHKQQVIEWESQFWRKRLRSGMYAAPVDTTFALYRRDSTPEASPAVRLGPPYVARHMPWYSTEPTEEDLHYFSRSTTGSWGQTPVHFDAVTRPRTLKMKVHWQIKGKRTMRRHHPTNP